MRRTLENTDNLRYADDTTLVIENENEVIALTNNDRCKAKLKRKYGNEYH